MMQSREHKFWESNTQYPLSLPSHLAVLKLEDVLSSIVSEIQSRYLDNMIEHEAYINRLQHVQRRRPSIYLDFNGGMLLRRCTPPRPLPRTLTIAVLVWLFRHESIGIIDFHLLPRSKRPLLGAGKGDLQKGFGVEISRLQGFLTENNIPVEIGPDPTTGCPTVHTSYVNSNIHEAKELAECAQHRLELGVCASAAALTEQALIIDPDCRHAISTVHRLLGCSGIDGLYRPAVFGLVSQTRDLLALTNNIDRISTYEGNDGLAKEIINKANQGIVLLEQRLRRLWSWLEGSDKTVTDTYPKVLHFIGQAALAKVGRGDLSHDEAFQQLISHPSISEAIHGYASTKSPRNAESVENEIAFRFWRLLFIDGWLPPVTNMEGFVSAFQDAMKSRFRVSNTPNGAARIPAAEYRDDWYRDKEQEEEKEQ